MVFLEYLSRTKNVRKRLEKLSSYGSIVASQKLDSLKEFGFMFDDLLHAGNRYKISDFEHELSTAEIFVKSFSRKEIKSYKNISVAA